MGATAYPCLFNSFRSHYTDVIMGEVASQITSLAIVYSTVYSSADQRKHQSSASLAFVRGIHRWPVNSPRKGPVTRKMFPFDDVIMKWNIDTSVHWDIISADNGLSPVWRHAITWTNVGILLTEPLRNTSKDYFSLRKIYFEMFTSCSLPQCVC